MILTKSHLRFLVAILFLLASWQAAEAAVLYVAPSAKNVSIGEAFYLDVKVNTEATAVNAAQATVHFPNSILTATGVDKNGSIFNFWVEEPVISNENGTVSFIGGTPKGISGDTLQLLRVKFKATGTGAAAVTITDAVVTASDGQGTNVFSKSEGSKIGSGGTQVTAPVPAVIPVVVEPPKKIERAPIVAKNLPNQPQLSVPLYPDPLKWYSHDGELTAFWDVPEDVVAIATQLDHTPNSDPKNLEKELFTGKVFGSLEEGVWYLHVKFKNNIGWGPVAHYKISIDRTVPVAFEVKVDSPVTENPAPTIKYETNDALSGLGEIDVFIDNNDPVKVAATSTAFTLPLQPPGKHRIVVRAIDKAGNAIEDDQNLEISPLTGPIIDFAPKSVDQGEVLFISGKSTPGEFVDVTLKNSDGTDKAKITAVVDKSGEWRASIEELVPTGTYSIVAVARDSRGALSYPTDPLRVRVRAKTIISIGPLDLGVSELVIFGLLIVIFAVIFVYWHFMKARNRRGVYRTIAMRDVEKLSTMMLEDVKTLETLHNTPGSLDQGMAKMKMAKLKDNANKMKKYLSAEIEKLK